VLETKIQINTRGRTTDLKTSLDSPGVNPGKFGGTGTPFSTLFQGQNQYDWRSKSDFWRGEGGGGQLCYIVKNGYAVEMIRVVNISCFANPSRKSFSPSPSQVIWSESETNHMSVQYIRPGCETTKLTNACTMASAIQL
jgi:hypothetical protein